MDINAHNVSLASVGVHTSKATQTNASSAKFSATLDEQLQSKKEKQADYVSGSIGVDLNRRGVPSRFVFFDDAGNVLTKKPFSAVALLEHTDRFNIPLSDLKGLGEKLDADGVGYKPYELYGESSNHGLDFNDLMNGGLGTAYDWRVDDNVHLKGPSAVRSLQAAQDLAERLGLQPNMDVTNISQMYGSGPKFVAPNDNMPVSSSTEVELLSVLQTMMSNLDAGQKSNFLSKLKQML